MHKRQATQDGLIKLCGVSFFSNHGQRMITIVPKPKRDLYQKKYFADLKKYQESISFRQITLGKVKSRKKFQILV